MTTNSESHNSKPGRPRLNPRAYEIAARVRARRLQVNLTTVEVARKLGVPNPRYRSWEKQLGPATERQHLKTLGDILQVDPLWLSDGIGSQPGLFSGSDEQYPEPQLKTSSEKVLSSAEREILAQRALTRRVDLKLGRKEVAMRIGTQTQTLRNWEQRLPQNRKDQIEEKWEHILGVPNGWLRQSDCETTPAIPELITESITSSATTVSEEIRTAAAWLCRANFAKRTVDQCILTPSEQRLADIFSLRYGVGGEENSTLQVIGDRYQLSRERIRQIVEKMAERSSRLKFTTTCIDRLAGEIKPYLPATVATLDQIFRPLLGESLSLESANRFCREILGRSLVTMTDRPANMYLDWSPTVIDPENHDSERIRAVRDTAMSMIRSTGAAHVLFVTGAASQVLGRGILPSDVTRDLRAIPGFEWLIEADGWFWFGQAKENRLVSVATKILIAAGQRVDAEEILAGFIRSRRSYHEPDKNRPYLIEPPEEVVVQVLKRTAGINKIQYDDFYLASPIPLDGVLSDSEKAVYQHMAAHGNVASRFELNANLVETGRLKPMSLHLSLNTSPIYRCLDRGVFALRGAPLAAEAFKKAKLSVGGEHEKSYAAESDADGFMHIRCTLNANMVNNRYWSLPSSVARQLTEGEYTLEGFSAPVVFSRGNEKNNRLKQFLNKLLSLGYRVGDEFTLSVNPTSKSMRITKDFL